MKHSTNHLSQFISGLTASPFFDSASQEAISFLSQRALFQNYPAGAAVFWEGDPSQGLFWLHSGTLKAIKVSANGREQILHLIEPGHTFNEVGAFTTSPNPASIIALSESRVWQIPGEAIRQLLHRDPVFSQSIINVLADRLRRSITLIEDLSLRSLTSRLARLILEEAKGDTLFRPVWFTQNELASRLGTVADVIQRVLRRLEAEELIAVERRQIVIKDREGLEKQVE